MARKRKNRASADAHEDYVKRRRPDDYSVDLSLNAIEEGDSHPAEEFRDHALDNSDGNREQQQRELKEQVLHNTDSHPKVGRAGASTISKRKLKGQKAAKRRVAGRRPGGERKDNVLDTKDLLDANGIYEFEAPHEVAAYLQNVKAQSDNTPGTSRNWADLMTSAESPRGCEDNSPGPSELGQESYPVAFPDRSPEITPYVANNLRLQSMFRKIRDKIRSIPISKLADVALWRYHIPHIDKAASIKQHWRRWRTTAPTLSALALMEINTILALLQFLTPSIGSGQPISKPQGAWILGLLAAIPTEPAIDHELVGVLRSLGDCAVLVMDGYGTSNGDQNAEPSRAGTQQDDEARRVQYYGEVSTRPSDDSGLEASDPQPRKHQSEHGTVSNNEISTESPAIATTAGDDFGDLTRRKAELLEQLHEHVAGEDIEDSNDQLMEPSSSTPPLRRPDDNTRLTLEMIVLIVGVEFAQHDIIRTSPYWQ